MADFQPSEMNSLFCDVMKHSGRFQDVTTDEGARNFNQTFLAAPLPAEEAAEAATPISIEVIDSVVRKESGFIAGVGDKTHVEYIIAIKRGLLLKTLGKRYSELHEFHNLLVEHKLIDKIKAPPFPEKQSFRDGWRASRVRREFLFGREGGREGARGRFETRERPSHGGPAQVQVRQHGHAV